MRASVLLDLEHTTAFCAWLIRLVEGSLPSRCALVTNARTEADQRYDQEHQAHRKGYRSHANYQSRIMLYNATRSAARMPASRRGSKSRNQVCASPRSNSEQSTCSANTLIGRSLAGRRCRRGANQGLELWSW